MPETEPRLGYSKGVLEQLRAQHAELSREELLELVCALTKEYVLDKTIPFDFPLPERADELRADPPDAPAAADETSDPPQVRFARLIEGMKQRTQLPQFEGFSIESGQAVLVVDNQKVVFGDRVTVRMVTGRRTPSRPAPPESAAPPGASPPPAATPPPPTSSTPTPAPRPAPAPPLPRHDDEDEDHDAGVERFRGLDLG